MKNRHVLEVRWEHRDHNRQAGRKSIKQLMEEYGKQGGRPRIDLPTEQIKELHDQGLGYKAITSRLREQGYEVSYATVYRHLIRNK